MNGCRKANDDNINRDEDYNKGDQDFEDLVRPWG